MNEREVTRIHNPVVQPEREKQKKRVFCYLRVSTEVQSSSMESQMEGFNQKIAASSDWQLAGVYADEGLSGTRAKKRPQFLKMIEDAKAGGCDIILCKSLSRFARNTVDALTYVRLLKEYGEAVIALMVTRYISDHVSKAELGEIINPRVIKLNPDAEDKADRIQLISTDIDAPKLAALLDAAKAWYNTTGRGYDDELMAGFNEAVDQLLSDFDGMRYIQTGPVNFYQYLADLYMRL